MVNGKLRIKTSSFDVKVPVTYSVLREQQYCWIGGYSLNGAYTVNLSTMQFTDHAGFWLTSLL